MNLIILDDAMRFAAEALGDHVSEPEQIHLLGERPVRWPPLPNGMRLAGPVGNEKGPTQDHARVCRTAGMMLTLTAIPQIKRSASCSMAWAHASMPMSSRLAKQICGETSP